MSASTAGPSENPTKDALGGVMRTKTQLDEFFQNSKLFKAASEKTKIPPEALGYIVLGGGFLALLFGFGADVACDVVGFLYPAYCSFKAIETINKDDDTQWLIYWVVYAAFSVAEHFFDYLLFWIPFYYFTKIFFLIWCFLPETRGAEWLYKTFIRPFLQKHSDKIDAGLAKVTGMGSTLVDQAADAISGKAAKYATSKSD
eukprot:Clim_evm43s153 gene=Clim_evmTU43s153